MSQDWVADLYTVGTVGDTTLANMELMFATLRSSFSGGSSPSNPVDGNLFYDSSTKKLLKVYRDAEWVGVLCGSAAFKMWVYLNAAEDGWVVDTTTATDRVLALKGGTTYATGGANAGDWQLYGISVPSHSAHTHDFAHDGSSGYATKPPAIVANHAAPGTNWLWAADTGTGWSLLYGKTANPSATLSHSPSHNGNDRPAAAVGTLQRPDV